MAVAPHAATVTTAGTAVGAAVAVCMEDAPQVAEGQGDGNRHYYGRENILYVHGIVFYE